MVGCAFAQAAAGSPAAPPATPPRPEKPGAALADLVLPPCDYKPDTWIAAGSLQPDLEAGRFDAVEAVLEEFHASYERNAACERRMLWTFEHGFAGTPETLRAGFDRWVAARPEAWTAWTLRGLFWVDEAYRRRGAGWAKDVDPARMERMHAALARAAPDLERAHELRPGSVVPYIGRIAVHRARGEANAVERTLRNGLTADPRSVELRLRAIAALAPWWGGNLASIAAVVANARSELQRNPRLARVFGHLDGMRADDLLRGPPQPDSALRRIALYSAALRFNEVASDWHYQRAKAYIDAKAYELALLDISWGLEARPDVWWWWEVKATALNRSGRGDEALAVLAAAAARFPENPQFPWFEARIARGLKRYGESARACRKALALDRPESPLSESTRASLLRELGEAYLYGERYVAAEEPLRRLTALRPNEARGWVLLGQALWEQGKRDAAALPLRRYLELSAADESEHDTRRRVREKLDEFGLRAPTGAQRPRSGG